MKKNTASQRFIVKAFDDNGAVTGDAANITCKLAIDGGTYTAITDVNPVEIESSGQYVFDLTQAETDGYELSFLPVSATSGVQVMGMPTNVIYTTDPSLAGDLSSAVVSQLGSMALTPSQQLALDTDKTLTLYQGDDYQANPIRIEIDHSGLQDPEDDLTAYSFVVSFRQASPNSAPWGFRSTIQEDDGTFYTLFAPTSEQTERLPIGRHPALYRIQYSSNAFYTVSNGFVSVLPHDIHPSEIQVIPAS